MANLSDEEATLVLLALDHDYAYIHLHIPEQPATPLEIPTWDLETKFDFSLHNEHMVGIQIASKPFDVHGEEGVGSCFLKSMGTREH